MFRPEATRLYLVGGSWRVIARLDMERRNYPLTVLHEYRMMPQQILRNARLDRGQRPAAAAGPDRHLAERMELVPLASEVLRELIAGASSRARSTSRPMASAKGLLYEQMPDRLRARDPLIEAARMAEVTTARMPGFGKKLFGFLEPLFQDADHERLRLIRAACLLHDTTWRAHPDYRAEVCFDNATRANLGGLDHPGRVFLGLALLHRYKNSRAGSRLEPLFRLLTDEQIRDAEVLGKAMRFGAMFSVAGRRTDGRTALVPEEEAPRTEARPRVRSALRRSGRGAIQVPGLRARRDEPRVLTQEGGLSAPLAPAAAGAHPPRIFVARWKPDGARPLPERQDHRAPVSHTAFHTLSIRNPYAPSRRGTLPPHSRHSLTTFEGESGDNKKKPENPCTKAQDQWHTRAHDTPS